MMEATLLLAAVAQRFQFRAVPGDPIVPAPSFTLRPKHGIRMTLQARVLAPGPALQLAAAVHKVS